MADTPLRNDVLLHETKYIFPNTNLKTVQSIPTIRNKPIKRLKSAITTVDLLDRRCVIFTRRKRMNHEWS
jgi:hypothetical protein